MNNEEMNNNNLTLEDAIKYVIIHVCTQMNLNENESEDIIRHISNGLSNQE
ncbi:3346_t:CDS:1, partial [Racocetra persica]